MGEIVSGREHVAPVPGGPGTVGPSGLALAAAVAVVLTGLSSAIGVIVRAWALPPGVIVNGDPAALAATRSLTVSGVVLFLIAAVLTLVWLWGARCAAEGTTGPVPRWSRGWSVGAWCLPVANLVLPPLVVADVWRASAPPQRRRPVMVALWWGATLLSFVLGFGANLVQSDESAAFADPAENGAAVLHTVEALLYVAAAALFAVVVLRISRWQRHGATLPPADRSSPAGPPVAVPEPDPPRESAAPPEPGPPPEPAPPRRPLPPPVRDVGPPKPRVVGPAAWTAIVGVALVVAIAIALTLFAEGLGHRPITPATRPVGPAVATDTLVTGAGVTGLVISPRGDRLYTIERGETGPQLAEHDLRDENRIAEAQVPVPEGASDPLMSPDGSRVYVPFSSERQSGIDVVTVGPERVERRIGIPGGLSGVALARDGTELYVCLGTTRNEIDVLAVGTGAFLAEIPTSQPCRSVVPDPAGATVYAVGDQGLDAVDTGTRTVSRTIPGPRGAVSHKQVAVAGAPDGTIYLAAGTGVTTVDPRSGAVGSLPTGDQREFWLGVAPGGGRLYVLGQRPYAVTGSDPGVQLSIVDLATGVVAQRLPVSTMTLGPSGGSATPSPDGRRLYVARSDEDAGVDVIDTGLR